MVSPGSTPVPLSAYGDAPLASNRTSATPPGPVAPAPDLPSIGFTQSPRSSDASAALQSPHSTPPPRSPPSGRTPPSSRTSSASLVLLRDTAAAESAAGVDSPSLASNCAPSSGARGLATPSQGLGVDLIPSIVDLAPSAVVDPTGVRVALEAIAVCLDRSEAYEALHADHVTLQSAYRESRRRVEELEDQLRDAAAAASPFVSFCQQRYDVLQHTLETARIDLADCQNALAERIDNAREVVDAHERLALQRRVHDESVQAFHRQIDRLESQIALLRAAVAESQAVSPPLTNRTQLEADMAAVRVDRDAAITSLQQLQDTNRALEMSQHALECSVEQLRRQVSLLERRVTDLRTERDQQRTQFQIKWDRTQGVRDQLQGEVDRLTAQLHVTAEKLQRAVASRNQSADELRSTQSHVANARSAIARLEQRVSGLQVNREELQRLHEANAALASKLSAARADRVALVRERDQLERERDDIRRRVAGLVNWVQPTSASLLSTSSSSRRRLRSSSRSPSSGPPRSRRRTRDRRATRSPAPSSRVGSSSPTTPQHRSPSRTRTSPGGSQSRSDAGNASSSSDSVGVDTTVDPDVSESSEDDVRVALARTRSDLRRRSSSGSGGGTSSHPIDVGDSSSSSSSTSPVPVIHRNQPRSGSPTTLRGQARSRSPCTVQGRVRRRSPSPGSGRPTGSSGNAQAASGTTMDAVPHRNLLITDAELDRLPATLVPRDEWIPGYRTPRMYRAADVSPWPLPDVLAALVLEMTVDALFHRFSSPPGWLYPLRSQISAPSSLDWSAELITEANLVALLDEQPWEVLNVPVVPMSFDMEADFEPLVEAYIALEDEYRQAFWESTHALPISTAMQNHSLFLKRYYIARKQRRSRAGARWKSFLRLVLRGLIAGYWDIDLLLDPFFLHFPQTNERTAWYPGLGTNPPPASLIEALRAANLAEPWRNHYRDNLGGHPAHQIGRLNGKFRASGDHV